MLLRYRLISIRLLIGACISVSPVAAEEFAYPGAGSVNTVYYPASFVENALQAFWRGNGRWPTDWTEIEQTGMIQLPLYTPDGKVIDPGDGRIDFRFDVVYDAAASANEQAAGGKAIIRQCFAQDGVTIDTIEVAPVQTYRELLMTFAPQINREWEPYVTADSVRLMMAASMIQRAALAFHMINGRWPDSVQEFLDSGLSPLDNSSTNPVTGKAFRFDGSAQDIEMSAVRKNGVVEGLSVHPVDADGNSFHLLNPY